MNSRHPTTRETNKLYGIPIGKKKSDKRKKSFKAFERYDLDEDA